ncbi:gallidermin/nisin family lantibiotic [Clostridium botulinum]|nr:gallidermin/nisin family lantibiotic [Clostridium botulinum]MBY6878801.1 gallidermin/nisin family lantibiotic [Clostridium botulinum]NEZ77413.1 gallidermin/nisin family lantibiotic [Clostridium botulinum]NFA01587.1 gallidermin/nisin family lantibiotic [Clostridium botulinum]NFA33342.1 gallidermin/nisin family lantibiotic [Clostridium botulinum]NFA87288.1 gallidermin/nisin family lantibiotic [Clostridium botulinum]
MGKFDDFDLDISVKKENQKEKKEEYFSIVYCTPGTCCASCYETCGL